MKVALDVSAVPAQLAGAGRYVAELARLLPPRVSTTLVTRRDDDERWRTWSPDSEIAAIVPTSRVGRLLYEVAALGTSTAAREADVWHAPHYTMPRRGLTPTVVTVHDLTFFTNPEWHEPAKVTFFRRAIAYSARHANVIISVSDFTARQIDEYLPRHAPVVVAPHGVDLERFNLDTSRDEALLRHYGIASDVPYIFFLGTVEPRKGLDTLLAAFARVARENPTIELWLAGQSGWGLREFEESLAVHSASSRIRRLGFVDEEILPTLLRRSRVVAYPSRGEGFGLPVLEAMACGAAVITSANTVMAEVAGDCATLIPIDDVEALAHAVTKKLTESADSRYLAAQISRARAEQFTWGYSLDQHLLAYSMARQAH